MRALTRSFLFVALLSLCAAASAQQILYTGSLTSNPADTQTNVLRERGRKGLDYNFKYEDGGNFDSPAGFPLNLSSAVVTVQIGANVPVACTAGGIPAVSACTYSLVAGNDDADLDTIRILYNGDFPASTNIIYRATGVKSTPVPAATQDPNNQSITFTTGMAAPRNPADIELVFDISGSMALPAVPAGLVTRMQALKDAAQSYFLMLGDYGALGDKTGVVYFASAPTIFDPTAGGSNLEQVKDAAKVALIQNNIQAQIPTFATSIGGGLQAANANGFAMDPGTASKNVILFSDGEQNTLPDVAVPAGVQVGGVPYVVDRICPVTAGMMTAPGYALQQQIANAACSGRHAHIIAGSTFTPGDLNTYFTQVLSDIVQGDKVELAEDLVGSVTNAAPVSHSIIAAKNDAALSILLAWDPPPDTAQEGVDVIPFRLIAPDGAEVEVSHLTRRARNVSFTTVHLPLFDGKKPRQVAGKWTIELLSPKMRAKQHQYQLIVMLDSPTTATEYKVEAKDVGTGDPIVITARLTDSGSPVTGGRVVADVLAPNDGIGNLLSRLKVHTEIKQTRDVLTPATQKLNALASDPANAALFANTARPRINLVDDGTGRDAAANDGIYTGVYPTAAEEGHYRFRFHAQGGGAGGEFRRVWTETMFVRPKPDTSRTAVQLLGTSATAAGTVYRIRITPRDRLSNLLGPDYSRPGAFQLSVDISEGEITSGLQDRLDGTYDAALLVPPGRTPKIYLKLGGKTFKTLTYRDLSGLRPR
jgi:hypothetical protein